MASPQGPAQSSAATEPAGEHVESHRALHQLGPGIAPPPGTGRAIGGIRGLGVRRRLGVPGRGTSAASRSRSATGSKSRWVVPSLQRWGSSSRTSSAPASPRRRCPRPRRPAGAGDTTPRWRGPRRPPRRQGPARDESGARRPLGRNAVEHERVEVDVRVERAPESLHDGHGAAPSVRYPSVGRRRGGHAPGESRARTA